MTRDSASAIDDGSPHRSDDDACGRVGKSGGLGK